jgi:hypothetical protein
MYPKILLNILYEGIESHKGLRLLVGFTMDQFEFGDAEPVDELLAEADFSRMDPIFSNGILRYTCSKQMYLKNWKGARDRVINDYKFRGLDWENRLRGLLEDYEPSPFSAAFDSMIGVHHTLIPEYNPK